MERALEIGGFRNIGFLNNGEIKKERIVLSNSLYKNEVGDLVIIIGENNSGKSNVLDAIDIFFNKKLSERDLSDLFDESKSPYLKYSCKENRLEYYLKKELNLDDLYSFPNFLDNNPKKYIERYNKKYNLEFIPKVIRYKESNYNDFDLTCNILDINNFFKNIFKTLKLDIDYLEKIKDYNDLLSNYEDKINIRLKAVSNHFNKIYSFDNGYYDFRIILNDNITFEIYKNSKKMRLDYQSIAFNWFFDLYFSALSNTKLNPGDIILMDEPACHLHVRAQRQFRSFLKEYAIKNDITIVMTTNSPFLIDLDYLDEVRIVVNDGFISRIENSFAAVNPNDPDSLIPIKEALTIENHIILNPDNLVIFVEGITDYNYLTAMKHLLGYKNINFLPIQGVGANINESIIISNRLLQINKSPILLVDNDSAGQNMKKLNEESKLKVLSLNDACEKFTEIESLFTNEDLVKYSLIEKNGKVIKHSSTSTIFKNEVMMKKKIPSIETINNFKKLFDFLFKIKK